MLSLPSLLSYWLWSFSYDWALTASICCISTAHALVNLLKGSRRSNLLPDCLLCGNCSEELLVAGEELISRGSTAWTSNTCIGRVQSGFVEVLGNFVRYIEVVGRNTSKTDVTQLLKVFANRLNLRPLSIDIEVELRTPSSRQIWIHSRLRAGRGWLTETSTALNWPSREISFHIDSTPSCNGPTSMIPRIRCQILSTITKCAISSTWAHILSRMKALHVRSVEVWGGSDRISWSEMIVRVSSVNLSVTLLHEFIDEITSS